MVNGKRGWLNFLTGAGISFYPSVSCCNSAYRRISTSNFPFFLVVADCPDLDFPSGRYGRPHRGSPVCVGKKLWNASPTYDQAFSVHPVPFYFRDLIQKFYPVNQGAFQGVRMRQNGKSREKREN